MPTPSIILIGLRGSGKSTLGRELANRLGLGFVDLDDVTPGLLGAGTVGEAWAAHGEGVFRRAESKALGQTLATQGIVLALGGGTPVAPESAGLLNASRASGRAVVVYLRADAATLRARLKEAGSEAHVNRPSLTGASILDEIDAVLLARDPLYLDLADHVVQTDQLNVERALDAVERISRSAAARARG
ncbi:MAG: shikimate kinase [Phycisphaerae bacterium]|nr:shikimate kinase [Phycisphaerae bacterium]